MISVTTWKWVPPFARGLVRDLRVRWALEEAGIPYRTRLIALDDKNSAEHRERQPFGQVPVLKDGELTLFESGAIALHIGEQSETLLPSAAGAKARAITWLFAALNTVEPPIQRLAELDLFHSDTDWAPDARPTAERAVKQRLADLAAWLGDREYLEDRFTVADLMTTTVLRTLRHTKLIDAEPRLKAYQARCEARPAFQQALGDHMAVFETT